MTVLQSMKAMYSNLPGISLIENPWSPWPVFRRLVANMHLLLQPSYSESFNMTTSDGVVEGVPSVVSEAISWAPEHWKASVDDALDIARVGRALLFDQRAAADGKLALEKYVRDGLTAWKQWLGAEQ